MLDNAGLVLLEERSDLRGQERDRARHDELVHLESPCSRGPGHCRQHGEQRAARSQGFRICLLYRPDETPEGAQVPRIPRIHIAPLARGAFELWRLQQHRQVREARVVQQPSEWLEAQAPLADVLVPIDTAAARFFRVVQVEDLHAIEADNARELAEGCFVALFACRCRSRRSAGGRCRGTRRPGVIHSTDRGSPPGARSDVRDWSPGRRCARAESSFVRAAAPRAATAIASPIRRSPSCSVPVVYEPGCMTRPSSPSASARSHSSPSASIDCARSAGAAAARLIR